MWHRERPKTFTGQACQPRLWSLDLWPQEGERERERETERGTERSRIQQKNKLLPPEHIEIESRFLGDWLKARAK